MYKVAVIGGTGTHGFFPGAAMDVDTLYGKVEIIITKTEPKFIYIPRHGLKQKLPPNEVNYRAIIDALLHYGVKYVVSTTIATKLSENIEIGDIVVPHDIIDLTTSRQKGFDPSKNIFIDMREVFSEKIRSIIIDKALEKGLRVHDRGVVVVIDGPRFETPAEARMYRIIGGDILSMSIAPEAFMAKEVGLEYAALAIVLNEAADKGYKLSREEFLNRLNTISDKIRDLIIAIVKEISSLQQ